MNLAVNDLVLCRYRASILQMLKLPDGTVKVLVEGLQRARITTLSDSGEHFAAQAEYLEFRRLMNASRKFWFAQQLISLKAISN
jgi:ATP-dependent Lon protease